MFVQSIPGEDVFEASQWFALGCTCCYLVPRTSHLEYELLRDAVKPRPAACSSTTKRPVVGMHAQASICMHALARLGKSCPDQRLAPGQSRRVAAARVPLSDALCGGARGFCDRMICICQENRSSPFATARLVPPSRRLSFSVARLVSQHPSTTLRPPATARSHKPTPRMHNYALMSTAPAP